MSSPAEVVTLLTGASAADYTTLLPVADTLAAIPTGLPRYDANGFAERLHAAAPIGKAVLGTAINLAGLFDV